MNDFLSYALTAAELVGHQSLLSPPGECQHRLAQWITGLRHLFLYTLWLSHKSRIAFSMNCITICINCLNSEFNCCSARYSKTKIVSVDDSLVWFILRLCQHDNVGHRFKSTPTNGPSFTASQVVTHPGTNRVRRDFTSVNVPLATASPLSYWMWRQRASNYLHRKINWQISLEKTTCGKQCKGNTMNASSFNNINIKLRNTAKWRIFYKTIQCLIAVNQHQATRE